MGGSNDPKGLYSLQLLWFHKDTVLEGKARKTFSSPSPNISGISIIQHNKHQEKQNSVVKWKENM